MMVTRLVLSDGEDVILRVQNVCCTLRSLTAESGFGGRNDDQHIPYST